MRKKLHVKSGDMVEVIAGKDKGKTGKVSKLYANKDRVLVEGVNMVKRHAKPTQQNPQGGIVENPATIHVSNVLLLDPKTNKGVRTGRRFIEGKKGKDGHWSRVNHKTGTIFE